MIKVQEAGMTIAEVGRRHSLSPASFYEFKCKDDGMNVSQTHRIKSLEDENGKLKRLLASTMLGNIVLEDLLESTDVTECATGCSTQGNAGS